MPSNAIELLKAEAWDVVLDCSDNVNTRYLLNDACVLAGKPLVSACALAWEGNLTIYNYHGGPCYRCMFPEAPPTCTVKNCRQMGVVGPVPGVLGTMQANETIKLLIGRPDEELLVKRLVVYDALRMTCRTLKIRGRNPKCDVCGDEPKIKDTASYDYEGFCKKIS